MPRVAVAVLLACQACVIVPRVVQHEPVVLATTRSPLAVASVGAVALDARFTDDRLTVVATRERTCRREIVSRVDDGIDMHAGLDVPNLDCGRVGVCATIAALGLLVSPLTLVASGIATAIEMSQHEKHQIRTITRVETSSCPMALANVELELVLASSRTVAVTSDADGRAELAIPDDEPPTGVVVARLADARATVRYVKAEACVDERAAAYARASTVGPQLRAGVLARVPECRDADAAAWRVITSATSAAQHGTCARIAGDVSFVRERAPDAALAFESEPDVAACLDVLARAQALARASVAGRSRR